MPYSIIITKNARLDIQDAIDWENDRQQNLGSRLLIEIEEKLLFTSESPFIWAIRYDHVRCAVTDIFSYLIHYTVNDAKHQITVLRILHTSRKPIW